MLNAFLFIYFTILGLCVGSFLNVAAARIPIGESIVHPPSRCPHCGNRLKVLDLLPVFSWLLLRGACRYCKAPVSWRYPLGEAAAGAMFAFSIWHFGLSWELLTALLFGSILLVAVMTDLRLRIIPNKVVYFGMACFVALRSFIHDLPLWHYALGFFIGGGIFYVLAVLSSGGMGGGDIKLFALTGLVVGMKLLLTAVVLSCLFGTLYGLILLFTGRYRRKMTIPFAPFIAAGSWLAYVWGNPLLDYYLHFYY